MSGPSSLAGFTPIPVQYSSSSTHYIYARTHTGSKKGAAQQDALPEGRTLFLVNVPPDATERELTLLFKQSGTVERVVFDGDGQAEEEEEFNDSDEDEDEEGMSGVEAEPDAEAAHPRKKRKVAKDETPQIIPLPTHTIRTLRRTGRSAHVVFLDASSVSRALSGVKARPWPRDPDAPSGLAHYLAQHAALRPPLDVVRAHADSWMAHFEFVQAKKRHASQYRKGEAQVDADGFTLVTRGGAYGQAVGGGVAVASKRFQQTGTASKRTRKSKKEPMEKEAFYAFQIHEKKRKEIMDLRSKWEEDKAKVEKLKESRKFKPY
ncbi:ribosomal RNA-processing protein 7 like protein [Phanerochaete sordida]|uniref:Ribosomal RNA-processing protein 7 like protein n=1 Tax=Phanerochaete sordida TaxID=48140 RepID=A0A9P3LAT0_9APHY|nr:ribosomal RNA-processing protein 7 like protein [Phanerochaete sordida]